MNDGKIISKENFLKIRRCFREDNKKIVLCHGVFDLLHYGHIKHLNEAKQQGEILVVSITASEYVNKGPGRPYFNDNQRMLFLSNLEVVDYVILSKSVTVHDIISYVQPDIYVKGQEYSSIKNDITGNIKLEEDIVKEYGGEIYFTQGETYSSTKLLNNFFDALPANVVEEAKFLKEKYGAELFQQIRKDIESFSPLKVLVIGDIIIDDYVFCKVQGLTTKDNVISTRYDFKERYGGGALAIARHIANFSKDVTLLSMMGSECDLEEYVKNISGSIKCEIVKDKQFITPVKVRFLKQHPQRQEYEKLFSMNNLLDQKKVNNVDYTEFYHKLEEMVGSFDLVVVCDYGHGLLNQRSIQIIEKMAKCLAVNCQTNSSNYGMNLITKYNRADSFVVDERELRLAFGQEICDVKSLLSALVEKLNSMYGWVTLGADGALGKSRTDESMLSAATLHVKDTVGAGDAFYSLAVLAAANKISIDRATLISNVAGAIKTNLIGNSSPIKKVDLLKFISTILNV